MIRLAIVYGPHSVIDFDRAVFGDGRKCDEITFPIVHETIVTHH